MRHAALGFRAQTAVFLIFSLLLIFARLGHEHLAALDDCYYAQKAKEMLASGEWLTPTYAGEPRYDNPPLFLWMIALSFLGLGVSNASAIFCSALSGALCIGLLHRVALRLAGPAVAFVSACVLLTTPYFLKYARHAMMDTWMTLLFLVAIYAYLRGRDGNKRWFLVIGVAGGAGVLTKSVLGLFPYAAIATHLLLTGRFRTLRGTNFVAGVGLACAIALPWYAWELAVNGQAMFDEHFGWLLWERAFGTGDPEVGYPSRFAYSYWPWLPVALIGLAREVRLAWRGDDTARLLLAWIVPVLAILQIADEKDLRYALPTFPALSIVCARTLTAIPGFSAHAKPIQRAAFALLAVAVAVVYMAPISLSRARQPALFEIAQDARVLVSEGETVLLFEERHVDINPVFLYYSDRVLEKETRDPAVFAARSRSGRFGLVDRKAYERYFEASFEIAAERGRWILTRPR